MFKNSVALWQSSRPLSDGVVDAATWTWLRRSILVHNPGLEGLLCLLDETVTASV